MEEYKVLITTSGLGSRLGCLTDKTNKCLVRVTDKPCISYIVESYDIKTKFVISLGYYGDHVRQYLKLAYPKHDFTFVDVDVYDGDAASLGYSILKCKNELNCPFIFHASDTIIKNLTIPSFEFNWIIGSLKADTSQYRTLIAKDSGLQKINEKGEMNYDSCYVGVCGIKDYNLFFEHLDRLVYNKKRDISDVHVINEMLITQSFKYIEISQENWFDVGNVSELNRTRSLFESHINVLDKQGESIFFFDDFVIKFFSDPSINKKRVERANVLKNIVPNIIEYSENFYKYKKAVGDTFSRSINEVNFSQLLLWTNENLWIRKKDANIKTKCFDFYINKTKSRIEKYLKEKTNDESLINGVEIPSINSLIDKINVDWLCNGTPSVIHGDFILDNIIESNGEFCLIDWREDFAGDIFVGDVYYDLAKLNHSLTINHDIIKEKLFSHNKQNCYILINSKINECRKLLHKFIEDNGYDIKKVELLTAIIWINMAALHEYPLNDFLFNFGKYNLYKAIKSYDNNK